MRGHAARMVRRPNPKEGDDYVIAESGCWVWSGSPSTRGYGKITVAGTIFYAHRFMYELHVGPIPDGLYIDHLCRNKMCVNPDHLEPVTHRENLMRGVGVKLTDEDISKIRSAPPEVMTKTLAVQYGISPSQMSRVRRGVKS